MARGTLRFWASARDAAGTGEEPYEGACVGDVLGAAARGRPEPFARLLAASSVLVDGRLVPRERRDEHEVVDGGLVEVLPPFAGG